MAVNAGIKANPLYALLYTPDEVCGRRFFHTFQEFCEAKRLGSLRELIIISHVSRPLYIVLQ